MLKRCLFCGKEFNTNRSHQKFCCPEHQSKNNYLRSLRKLVIYPKNFCDLCGKTEDEVTLNEINEDQFWCDECLDYVNKLREDNDE